MSAYTFHKHPTSPILFITCTAAYTVEEHLDGLLAEQFTQLDAVTVPVTVIVDVREAVHSLEELFAGAEKVAAVADRLRQHPNYIGTIYVTPRRVEQRMAELLNRELLGRQPAQVTATLEDAIDMALNGESGP